MFLTEAELRANVVNDDWNEEWVEKIIHTAGRSVEFLIFHKALQTFR